MATDKIQAKDVEIYIGKIATASSFDPSSRGNDTSLAEYIDTQITSANITDFTKYSETGNELSIEPAEDDSESRNYFGTNSDGAQNSETFVTAVSDVNITLGVDTKVVDELSKLGLAQDSITHTDYSDYASFNMGSKTTDILVMLIRIKKLVGSTYYYRNVVVKDPQFTTSGGISGASDDTVLTTEHTLLGNKSSSYLDFYSGATDESLTNY